MKKLLLILLAIVLIASLLRVPFEGTVSTPSGSGGSGNGGGASTPGEDNSEIIATWHDYGSCVATCTSVKYVCDNESCLSEYTEDEIDSLGFQFSETCSYASYSCYNCNCNNGSVQYTIVHCFVNGVCHECNYSCVHSDSMSLDQYYLSKLPANHPLREAFAEDDSSIYIYSGVSYVVEGVCQMCFMPVEG